MLICEAAAFLVEAFAKRRTDSRLVAPAGEGRAANTAIGVRKD